MQTIVRTYTTEVERDREIGRHGALGWQVQTLTHQQGRYRVGRGFVFAVAATPVAALLAGNTPDRWVVVFAAPPGTAEPPPLPGFAPPPLRQISPEENRAAILWALRWGAILLVLTLIGVAVLVAWATLS